MLSLWTILSWTFYGLVRYVMQWIPLITPFKVYRSIPSQWWAYNSWSDWMHYNDNNGGPDERWCKAWLKMCLGELEKRILKRAKAVVDDVKAFLIRLVGYIRVGFSNLGAWVDFVQRQVGYYLPSWASNISWALGWLRGKLPLAIRYGWQNWDEIWEGIKESVRNWARSMYDSAKSSAFAAWHWVLWTGEAILAWRNRVAGWLDYVRENSYQWIRGRLGSAWDWLVGFRNNPLGWISQWLGDDWRKLVEFKNGPLTFYYNLWSYGWRTLSDFVADPLGFVLSRMEQAVMDRW